MKQLPIYKLYSYLLLLSILFYYSLMFDIKTTCVYDTLYLPLDNRYKNRLLFVHYLCLFFSLIVQHGDRIITMGYRHSLSALHVLTLRCDVMILLLTHVRRRCRNNELPISMYNFISWLTIHKCIGNRVKAWNRFLLNRSHRSWTQVELAELMVLLTLKLKITQRKKADRIIRCYCRYDIIYGICTLPKPNYRPGNRFVIFFLLSTFRFISSKQHSNKWPK